VSAVALILTLVAAQRLIEIAYAARNTRALLRRGGIEVGRGHYPLFILLHGAWLLALFVVVPASAPIAWGWLALFVVLQALRVWVLLSLGPFWTTRVITLPNAPLSRRGPYRWLRHPNYLVVTAEIIVLPLVFGAWAVALIFTVLNLALLAWRVRLEDQTLAPRRRASRSA